MWGRMQALRKRRAGSLEAGDWPGSLGLSPAPEEAESKEARVERFKQQTLSSYTVTFSPKLVIGMYFAFALLFIPLGAAVIAGSSDVRSTTPVTYNLAVNGACSSSPSGSRCLVPFTVTRDIPAPAYLFYVVTNLHQNYREYVKSRSFPQLRGIAPTTRGEVRDCWPLLYRPDFANRTIGFFEENKFRPSEIRNPCGLSAFSRFNDSMSICADWNNQTGKCRASIPTSQKGIAWKSDRLHKYRPGEHFTAAANATLTDEAFMVWMRLSAFSRAEKLYGIISDPLPKGKYWMEINSRYPARVFDGDKQFFISNTKWFGAKNHFLGVLYVVTGVLSLGVALVILAAHMWHPRPAADFNPDLIRHELTKLSIEYGQANN